MRAILFLNGTPPTEKEILHVASQEKDAIFACTDGAYNYLYGKLPLNYLIGDFDSISPDLMQKVDSATKIIRFKAEKNFTDGFLAVKELFNIGVTSIDIYGASGGRPDHEQSNYLMLMLCRELKLSARIITDDFYIQLVGENFTASAKKGAIVSLVPFSDTVHILYTKGLKYPINDLHMSKCNGLSSEQYIMGVSNLAISDTVQYCIASGLALVFLQR